MSRPRQALAHSLRTVRSLCARTDRRFSPRRRPAEETEAARAAIDWLLRASEACDGRGFSLCYDLEGGWREAYIETTGYLVPTLWRACSLLGHREADVREVCDSSLEWLLEVQSPEGWFGSPTREGPAAFDTAQVLFALLHGWTLWGSGACRHAAVAAADWLSGVQDDDGAWRRFAYADSPHSYYTRAAWPLMLVGVETGEGRYVAAAERQLDWTLARQDEDGWYGECSFAAGGPAVLHAIAYTVEGMLECAVLSGRKEYLRAGIAAADSLAKRLREDGGLAGYYTRGWRTARRPACVTGLCQMALVWRRLNGILGEERYAAAARTVLSSATATQSVSPEPDLCGALPGSFPLWGSYFPWSCPNWSAKFLLDAVMADRTGERT